MKIRFYRILPWNRVLPLNLLAKPCSSQAWIAGNTENLRKPEVFVDFFVKTVKSQKTVYFNFHFYFSENPYKHTRHPDACFTKRVTFWDPRQPRNAIPGAIVTSEIRKWRFFMIFEENHDKSANFRDFLTFLVKLPDLPCQGPGLLRYPEQFVSVSHTFYRFLCPKKPHLVSRNSWPVPL